MFVIDDCVMPYPNKTIVEDMLSRDGDADSSSYTPWRGCAHLIQEQFKNNSYGVNVTVKDIMRSGVKDYSVHKSRANDDGVDRELLASDIDSYYVKLEDIDDEWVVKYIENILIGFKFNREGIIKSRIETVPYFYDDGDEEFVEQSDLRESVKEYTAEDVAEAVKKLPYLLKILHDGSKEYSSSLLSAIIAREKYYSKETKDFTPAQIIGLGLYKMNRVGKICGKYQRDENNGEHLRSLIEWTRGLRQDVYYKAYVDLMHVLSILKIDIRLEDPFDYQEDLIERLACIYVASNEEFIDTFGLADRNIITALSQENLFKIARQYNTDDYITNTVYSAKDDLVNNTEFLLDKPEWRQNANKVIEFLKAWNKYVIKTDVKLNTHKYDYNKGYLTTADGDYVVLTNSILGIPRSNDGALIHLSGRLVLTDISDWKIRYKDLSDVVASLKGGPRCEWTEISL